MTISGNHFTANEILFHGRQDTSSIKSFSNNEIRRRTSGPGELCAINTSDFDYSADNIEFQKNHWGAFSTLFGDPRPLGDPACAGTQSEIAFNNGEITFNAIFETARFKYKDRSPQ
jgi:hypothetical protein